MKITHVFVSVPYWGSLYFNTKQNNMKGAYIMFPSPIGVLYISIKFCRDNLSVVDGFRPLLGFFIFQSCPPQPL